MKKRKSPKSKELKPKQRHHKKVSSKRKPQSFVEFLRSSPLFGSGIDLTREPDPPDDEPLFPDC
jgi:hypothetical protein